MTAVLQATDALRRDRTMASDDSQINYSSGPTDWKSKYNEVADMLAETRAELDEFHSSSKELEEELIKEIDRTEKAQQDLKVKVARSETERDEWKSKFMTLQTNHNTTTTSLQRELDTLRQDYQKVKVQLRELEMGNDDLERNERAVSSSLADIEAKYSRALEEKILLEHELLDKANLEEECQRLKDELRDANVEISILKDQVSATQRSRSSTIISEPTSSAPSSLFPHVSPPSTASDENLLTTPPPPNLQLSDLSSAFEIPSAPTTTPRPQSASLGSASGQSILLQRAGFQPNKSAIPTGSGSSPMPRSATLPSLSTPSRIPPRIPVGRTAIPRNASVSTTSSASGISGNVSKSKGVQMVSEMRARVKILEQKIHTRVPRLRMGSLSGHSNANALAASTLSSNTDGPLASTPANILRSTSLRSKGGDDRSFKSSLARKRADIEVKPKKTPGADTSGWVLIMEDSPSPVKDTEKERRRASSPSAPTAFRLAASTSAASPTVQNDKGASLFKSTMNAAIRRPQSRLSTTSGSTTATTSSIPTPSSRPATPTFLPVPSSGLYAHSSTAGMSGLKRPVGPGTSTYSKQKRTSFGGTATTPSPPSDSESGIHERPFSYSSRLGRNNNSLKALPQLPSLQSSITMRPSSKLSASSSAAFSKSRIGRPSGGRRSSGGVSPLPDMDLSEDSTDGPNRPRAGSATATYAMNGY